MEPSGRSRSATTKDSGKGGELIVVNRYQGQVAQEVQVDRPPNDAPRSDRSPKVYDVSIRVVTGIHGATSSVV
jgi:hypothetical protein